jgi:dolichyl-phosphate-mannose-protein mannosyltransferase
MKTWKACAGLLCLLVWYAAAARDVLTSGDDYAYAAAAVDIATGTSLVHHFDSPILNSQYVAAPGEPGAYASKYPPGVSLLLVPLYLLGGFPAFFWLSPLMGVLGVYALYRLALQVTGDRAISLFATSILATLPAVVFIASCIGSDLPSLAFVTVALAVYARELEKPSVRGFWLFCTLSGASVLIRNPNVLVLAVVGLHQLWVHRENLRAQRLRWVGGSAIVLAFIAIQLGVNFALFGNWVGGYKGEAGAGKGLSLQFLPHHFPRYLAILCAVPPLGLPAVLWVTAKRARQSRGIWLPLTAIVLLYATFYGAWRAFGFDYRHAFIAGARFVLPALPLLCLGLAIALFDMVRATQLRRGLIALGLAAQLAASAYLTTQLHAFKTRMATHRDRIYAATTPDALVIGPGEWSKLFMPYDGVFAQRRYASYDPWEPKGGLRAELARLVDDALARGEPVFVLGSKEPSALQELAFQHLSERYRLVPKLQTQQPYVLRVFELQAP